MKEIFGWLNSAGDLSCILIMIPAAVILLWVWHDIRSGSDRGIKPGAAPRGAENREAAS